ncbi:MAG: class I SAM-dependent methyltransferase [Candidatus Rokubacteria bacterium]|nr:class I SAM-dependent methyltransferase [Candidatus Rokubacteria bacterium]MBI2158601.1 class I SAM-dependent methyltransferase [Candidatus Rokubacteria bacterium]MBI2491997.1 class I SAM-dependent methyltransferase [Candidatus Rokubacteria bacterium]MBI4255450.1 class I SAM-dependent methyltransferase [Candidatus Rokubacteria bacterium]
MEQTLDKQRVQEFARKLFGFYTSGVLTLMVDIGHKTGLFEAAAQGAGTSEAIAARAGLNERYVREWLGAMATGGVVEYDAATRRFSLPAEHAACLTGTSSRNLAAGSQTVPMLAKRLPRVVESFRNGGGVSYAEYRPDFTEAQDASWRLLYDGLLIKGFLPAAKGLPERLKAGISVADLGCGTGHAVNLMAREYPASRFTGYDFGEDPIARARAEAQAMGLANARFEVLDVTRLPAEPKFDLLTSFDAIHDQRDPAAVLRRAAEALAPGGVYLMIEPKASSNLEDNIGNPFAPYIYGMSVLHCMTVSLAAGGAGLGTAWGQQTARRMLAEAGFASVEVVDAPGPQNSIYVCRR